MYKDIFKKRKRIPEKIKTLLLVSGGLAIFTISISAFTIWWNRPIVIVRIGEFSLGTEVEKLNLEEKIKDRGLSANAPQIPCAPQIHGSLNIKFQNISKRPAQDIALNFQSLYCKLGELQIYTAGGDCPVEITPSAELRFNPDLRAKGAEPQDCGSYHISVKELKPDSAVQLKYAVYKDEEEEPVFKFGQVSSANAKVKVFYYRQ